MLDIPFYEITKDEIRSDPGVGPWFVTFGETMVRDTAADLERMERTRLVHLSMAGSEFTLAVGLSRLGIPSAYITRVPENPYGKALRNIARENGVSTDYFVWAPNTEPIGRFLYEIGRSPRKNIGVYQRMYSAASKLDAGMVDWSDALKSAKLFHCSGISFGLATHSNYERNYVLDAFKDALSAKPDACQVGLDFNYRGTLWSTEDANEVMTPIVTEHVNILITTIEDMAKVYGLHCGQYTPSQIVNGEFGHLSDEDINSLASELIEMFKLDFVAITIRYPDSFEQHRWESAAMEKSGLFYRSPEIRSVTLLDRLGGGDTWNAGFYYGLLTESSIKSGLRKGVIVGDAATRLKQSTMFDLPILDKQEIQALMKENVEGGGNRTSR